VLTVNEFKFTIINVNDNAIQEVQLEVSAR